VTKLNTRHKTKTNKTGNTTAAFIIMWPLHAQSYCNISMKNGNNVIILNCIFTFWNTPWYSWRMAEFALNNNHSLLLYLLNIKQSQQRRLDINILASPWIIFKSDVLHSNKNQTKKCIQFLNNVKCYWVHIYVFG
jgi:hypothetical protein